MPTKEEFVRFAQMHMDAIFRLAFSYLKSRADAGDVTQTVLLRLYESGKVFESDQHVKNWLLRVAVNECKKHWRSPWRRTECLEDFAAGLTFEEQRYSDLFQAIMALGQKYRTVIVLYLLRGICRRRDCGTDGYTAGDRGHPAAPGTGTTQTTFAGGVMI